MLKLNGSDEEFYLGNKKVSSAAHPMVCFSEYDIATIDKKVITYGKFGIAFTQSWVEKHNLHQVLYVDRNSLVAKSLATLLSARRVKATKLPPEVRLSIMMIKCFTKNAKGYNSHFKEDNFDFDFKSENEWRYVPSKLEIEGKLISQDSKKYKDRKKYYNGQWGKYSLKFDDNDIVCVFVESVKQVEEIKTLFSIDSKKIRISNWTTERK
jgi:hypothetical protein